jgi:hypothetical protein
LRYTHAAAVNPWGLTCCTVASAQASAPPGRERHIDGSWPTTTDVGVPECAGTSTWSIAPRCRYATVTIASDHQRQPRREITKDSPNFALTVAGLLDLREQRPCLPANGTVGRGAHRVGHALRDILTALFTHAYPSIWSFRTVEGMLDGDCVSEGAHDEIR